MGRLCAPLTKTQYGIYIECMQFPERTVYNVPLLQKLDSGTDVGRLIEAWRRVEAVHPLLRCHIAVDGQNRICLEEGENPEPVILPMTAEEFAEKKKDLVRPFDLDGGPLFRVEIYDTPEGKYLFIDIHHLIADGSSVWILNEDLGKAYAGQEPEPEGMTFAEISAEEIKAADTPEFAQQKAYYEKLLDGCETDCAPLPDVEGEEPEQGWMSGDFSVDEEAFTAFRRKIGISQGSFFTSVMGFCIARYSSTGTPVISTIHHGRLEDRMSRTVDMLVRTLPFVTDISKKPTVARLLKEGHDRLLECRERVLYSFADMASDFGVVNDITFAYQGKLLDATIMPWDPEKTERIYDPAHIQETKLLAELAALGGGKYRLHLSYRKDIYSESFAEGFIRAYGMAVKEFLIRENTEDILLADEEELRRLDAFNDVGKAFPAKESIPELFRLRAAEYPDNCAVICRDVTITYRELDALTDRLAAHLRSLGAGRETVTAVLIPRCEYMVICALGVLKTGGAYLPLDPTYPPERLNLMVEDSGASILISAPELASVIADSFAGPRILTDEIASLPEAEGPEVTIRPEDLFVMLYTSGSTGVPKGVMLEHGNLSAFCACCRQTFGFSSDSVSSGYASYGFDACLLDLYPALTSGGAVCIVPEDIRLDLPAIYDYFREHRVTHSFMTTQVARQFATLGNPGFLKVMNTGGEKLAPMDAPDYDFYNGYGPSETTVFLTHYLLGKKIKDIPIGRPVDNTKLYVVDSAGHRLPAGAAGELWAAGPRVSRGYLNRPEKTAEVYGTNPFETDPVYARLYRTGDIVRYLPDGNLQFVGRRDAQVKVRGFRVELTEVEEVIRRFEGIRDAAVVAYDDPAGGKFIAAYVISDETVDIDAMNAFILAEKPPYMVPAVTMQIDAIPYTQNQKVNRRALPRPERKAEDHTPPQNGRQQKIFDLAAELLGHRDFGIDTDFFMAGLTSIGTVQLNIMLAKEFGAAVSTRLLRDNSTVRKLDSALSSGREEAPKTEQADYPLTKTQMGILVECLSHPDSTIYNIPMAFALDDGIDPEKLADAAAEALSAHPGVLARLTKNESGEIRQRRCPGTETREGAKAVLREKIRIRRDVSFDEAKDGLVRPFELLGQDLFRIEVFAGEKTVLFTDVHHIVCDGTSLSILLEDISRAYGGEEVPPEEWTGFDAAADEERRLAEGGLEQARQHYLNLLSDADTDCLPPRTVRAEEESTAEYSRVCTADAGACQTFCTEKGISMSALFNGAFGYVLSRYTGRESVVYCTVYNGRSDPRMLRTATMLVKTFPVRCTVSPGLPAADYLKQTGWQMMDSMANDLFSFAEIAAETGLGADILFTWQGDLLESDILCGKPCRRITFTLDEAKAPIDIDALLHEGRVELNCIYRSDLYDEGFIAGLLESIDTAVRELTGRESLGQISLLSPRTEELLRSFNDTDYPVPQESAVKPFERNVKEQGDRTAVIAAGEELTYRELNELANRAAHALIGLGVKTDEIVGLMTERTKEIFIGELGILKSGGAFLPLIPDYPDERIDFCLRDGGCRYLLTTEKLRRERETLFAGAPYRVLTFEELLACPETDDPGLDVPPEALAYCIYTSGSTGTPKGVMIEHRNLRNFLDPNPKNPETNNYVRCGHVVLSVISFSFDFSLMETQLPLACGLTVCMASEDDIHDPVRLAELIKAHGADVMSCTPSLLGNLVDYPQMAKALSGMHLYDFGAEAFPASLNARLREVSPEAVICNGYGPTETTISCISKILDEDEMITIGRPAANVRAYCLDAEQKQLPPGACGELVIGGAGVGRGYVNLPEKTAEAFITWQGERVYRSGDIVRFRPDGEIEFFGRLDNQVKLRGFRVELDEIENRINAWPGMRSSKVIVRNNGSEDYLAGFFTADRKVEVSELTAFLKESLAYYMVPAVLMQLEHMPLTANGKVDKKRLPEVSYSVQREYVEPKPGTETEICTVFADVLHRDKVGAADDFFAIGGTSLSATNVVMRLSDMGYNVVYKNIFSCPTPRELAALLTGAAKEQEQGADEFCADELKSMLAVNTMEQVDEIRKKPLGNIILTGGTGFLGVHILKEFLEKEEGKIYCLIRSGRYKSPELRLKNMLMYYFGSMVSAEEEERIVCVEGDITDPQSLEALGGADAGLVINCAACVRHFARDNILEEVNIGGVKNLIDFCRTWQKELIQISTTSVGGMREEYETEKILHESDLYLGQVIDNEYIRTKYLGERAVLDAVNDGHIRGKVIRVGNLMSRESDGEFQINFVTNSFMRSLKAYRQLKAFPLAMMHEPAEFSPVDSTAEAILALAASESRFTVFHAYNSHIIYMSDVVRAMREYGFPIRVLPPEEFAGEVKSVENDSRYRDALLGLIAYDSGTGKSMYPVNADNRFTSEVLYRLGFFWPITDNAYLRQVIEVLDGFAFFDLEQSN